MPSGELCNQGHRSRAKQTRLCVCARSGGPGGAHGAGRGSGPASGPACLLSRTARVPRSSLTAAFPPPPPPQPRAGELRPESPRRHGRVPGHPSPARELRSGRRSSSGPLVPSPRPRGRRAAVVVGGGGSDHSISAARVGAARVAWRDARPRSLCLLPGGGVARRVTAARMTPSRRALAARASLSPHWGPSADGCARTDGPPRSPPDPPPPPRPGATQSFGKLRPYLAW